MNNFNLQTSFSNLPQVDRSQQTLHRMPVINQEQNADIQRHLTAQRSERPEQAEAPEGKITDPNDRRRENPSRKKRRPPESSSEKKQAHKNNPGGGFIDFSA